MGDSNVCRVLVIGASCVGKSSLINLLIGKAEAPVSDSARGTTKEIKPYTSNYNDVNYEFNDTIGLDIGQNIVKNFDGIKGIIEIAFDLKGFSCVLFVIRKGAIDAMTENNYHLFINYIFGNKIPTGLIVTHCDDEDDMNWYDNNKDILKDLNFNIAFAVCITSKIKPNNLRNNSKINVYDQLEKFKSNRDYPEILEKNPKYSNNVFNKFIEIISKILNWIGYSKTKKEKILKEFKKVGTNKKQTEGLKDLLNDIIEKYKKMENKNIQENKPQLSTTI